jgi:hypothetical protein
MTLHFEQISADDALTYIGGKGSWRQYPSYCELAAHRVGAASAYWLLRDGTAIIAVMNVRSRSLPFGLGSSGLVSQGPVLLRNSAHQPEDLAAVVAAVPAFCAEQAMEMRIDPDPLWPELPPQVQCDAGVRSPYRTIMIDLSSGMDWVGAGLHSKWRADLKKAKKAGLTVRRSSAPEEILQLAPLLDELTRKKGFSIQQDVPFFAEVARGASASERIMIHMVHRNEELLSGHIGAFSGPVAVYLLGATSPAGRKVGASHLAQWHAMVTACELGAEFYDTGGIDPEGNPDVYRFKRRMGGREFATPQFPIISPPGPRGLALKAARQLWTRIRG